MKEIKIVEGLSIYNLESTVKTLLNENWELYGDMKIRKDSDEDGDYTYLIVMVKNDN